MIFVYDKIIAIDFSVTSSNKFFNHLHLKCFFFADKITEINRDNKPPS